MGRVVLIKSVMNAISTYYNYVMWMPVSIHYAIDKIVRDFLWGSTEEKRKMSLVAWEVVCKPTTAGGLGIRSSKNSNIIFMTKLQWRLLTNNNHLWSSVFTAKYDISAHRDLIKLRESPVFKSICKGSDLLSRGTQWIPNSSSSNSFLE